MQDAGYSYVATDKSQVESASTHHNDLQPIAAQDRELNKKEPTLHTLHTRFTDSKAVLLVKFSKIDCC